MTDAIADPTTSSAPTGAPKRRVVRGVLWGLMLGVGMALVAVSNGIIDLALTSLIVTVLLGIVIGVLWSMFGPAKKS